MNNMKSLLVVVVLCGSSTNHANENVGQRASDIARHHSEVLRDKQDTTIVIDADTMCTLQYAENNSGGEIVQQIIDSGDFVCPNGSILMK